MNKAKNQVNRAIASSGRYDMIMAEEREVAAVSSPFQQWMEQGEDLYAAALHDFRSLEAQLAELEVKVAAKQAELNQIAQIVGKPAVEGNRRVSAQIVHGDIVDAHPERVQATTSSSASIARALQGKFGR